MIRADLPVVDGSTSTEPMRWRLLCELAAEEVCDVGESVPSSGTHDSFAALTAGDADVILVARAPSADEETAAAAAGVSFEVEAVAWDGFVFIVNASNPVKDLTLDQIRGIYAGEITNWSQVGGADLAIQPYQRDATSGSQELMIQLVMGDLPMIEAPELVEFSMSGPFEEIARDEAGIGYSVYYYADNDMAFVGSAVEMIAFEGVLPTAQTIAHGDYPLVTEVYAVIRAGDGGSARAFFDWLTTDDGQQAVAATGYVPLPSS
jgi:phosphate transport system substrate-binding protein